MKMTIPKFAFLLFVLFCSVFCQVVIKEKSKDGIEVLTKDPNKGNEVHANVYNCDLQWNVKQKSVTV
jgi:hypothetical protein